VADDGAHRTLAVTFAGFAAFLCLYATQPLLPLLAGVFNASKAAVSLTVTAATVGVAVSAPLIGNVADKLGRKRVIVWSAILMAATTLLAGTSSTLPALIFWRFLQGVCTPGIFAITVAYIQEEWASEGTGNATAAYVAGTVLGGFTGRFTSGLVAEHANWHMSFVALAAMALGSAAVLWRWLPKERRFTLRHHTVSSVEAAMDHLRNRRLIATYSAGFCVLFSLLGMFTWVTFYLAAPPFHLSTAALGSLFFVYLAGAVITPWCGRAIDRYGHRIAVTTAVSVSMLGVMLTAVTSLPVVLAGLALCCTGVFVAQSAASSYIGVAAEHNKALAVGLYVTFYYTGGSSGAALPAWLWNLGGWPACIALFVCVQLITIAIVLVWWKPVPVALR
jgi:MFS transporter, YNFM family, putative membrane transport protein